MSTIRSRRRWIRAELCVITSLAVVVAFPDSPTTIARLTVESAPFEKATALIEEAKLSRAADEGDSEAIRQLAWAYASDSGYRRFIRGDAEELLQPLVDAGDLRAVTLLASVVQGEDPQHARRLYLQAADMGDELAQVLWMREAGIDARDTYAFMDRLYRLQSERPGWKTGYNRYLKLLQTEAADGNRVATSVLVKLDSLRSRIES